MKVLNSRHQAARKIFVVLLLVLLAFQSLGLNGLAAAAAVPPSFQEGNSQSLTCGVSPGLSYCDIKIVLMIDDSGSMRKNDPRAKDSAGNDIGGIRNQGAVNLVDLLAKQYYLPALESKADNPDLRLPDVEVAVIHFSGDVKANPEWRPINPASLDDWEKQKKDFIKDINWANNYSTIQTTSFQPPLKKAAELLKPTDTQVSQGDCTKRSILIFTDGTPEDERGIFKGEKLKTEMKNVGDIVIALQEQLPEQLKTRIYISGFKVASEYWNSVEPYWTDIVNSVPALSQNEPLRVELLKGQNSLPLLASRMETIAASLIDVKSYILSEGTVDVPDHLQSLRLSLYSLDPKNSLTITDPSGNVLTADGEKVLLTGEDTSIEVWELINPPAGKYTVKALKPGGVITGLFSYPISLEFDQKPGPLQLNVPNNIAFKLVDSSGRVVLPNDDPPRKFNVLVSVIQGNQETPLDWTQDGDNYKVSWTPESSDSTQLKIATSLSNNGNVLLNCLGTVDLEFDSPPPSTPIVLTLVVGSPRLPVENGSVTLPLNLDYKGNKAPASSLIWHATASDLDDPNQTLTASVTPADSKTPGEYALTVSGLGEITKVRHIQAQVRADTVIDEQQISANPAATKFEIPYALPPGCTYNTSGWAVWFWPLVILLAALLIFLLVIFWRRRDEDDARRGRQFRLRRGDWHFLFWPLLALFILLILVRVFEWYCNIPPWIFLAALLLWLTMLVLVSFTPESNPPRPRPWWLVILLALLILVVYFIFPDWWPALILVELLALAWLIYWWRPSPPAVGVSLSLGSPLMPRTDDSATLPVELKLRGNQGAPSSLRWNFKSSGPLASWKVTPEEPDRSEYQLILDGMGGAGVTVELSADVEVDEQSLSTPLATAMIDSVRSPVIPVPIIAEHLLPVIISLAVPLDCVPEGKEIKLPVHLEIKEPTKVSSFHWTPPPATAIPGGNVNTSIVPVDEAAGEYLLKIDPVSGAGEIQVQVCAEAVVDGKTVEITSRLITIKICPPPGPPDDLTKIEGIGTVIASIFYRNGIFTFEELAQANIEEIEPLLKGQHLSNITNPRTWPQQAEVAARAKVSGDWSEFDDFVAYLKAGLPPEEWKWNR